jgi:hypothetical protein
MIQRKKKICKGCQEEKYIVSKGLCSYCKTKEVMEEKYKSPRRKINTTARSSTKRRPRKPKSSNKTKRKSTKVKSLKFLKSKAWRVFSKFIRLRDSDDNGYGTCITCAKPLFWKQLQAGHFIPQHGNPNTIFNEQNVHSQCSQCNIYLHGNQYIYSLRVDELYGEGTASEILILSKIDKRFTAEEYEQMYQEYSKRVEDLLDEKGLPE